MKVLLIKDVDDLGMAGEVKEVANGYGRNYLVPKGLAVLATRGALKDIDLHRRRAAERRQRIADEMAALAEAVRQTTLLFQAKAGETGRLYGSVTTAEVADKLAEAVGNEIDRRKISLENPIKQLGTHKVTLRLSTDVIADFDVVVESIDGPEAEGTGSEASEESSETTEESPETPELVEVSAEAEAE